MSMLLWSNSQRKVSELIPAKYNPRKLSDKDKKDLLNSLDKFSLADPIIINQNNTVIGGHMRLKVLIERGVDIVDVRIPDRLLSDDEERELNLRLNKNTGAWDESLLMAFDPQLLINAGFDGDYVDSLMKVETIEDDFDEDAAAGSVGVLVSKRGDVFILGDHRVMCGDSSDFNDVETLMGGGRAGLIYTDPPYNVDYKGKDGIQNDNQKDSKFVSWLTEVMKNAYAVSDESANLYCWFAMTNYPLFRTAIEMAGFKYMQVLTWIKDRFVLSRGWFFHRATEPCMIFYKDWTKKFVNWQYAKNDDVWDLDKLEFEQRLEVLYMNRDKSKDYEHPTQKPVRLAERALKRNSEPGMIVLDLFGGSGSTLICCEQLKRRAYLMEMDPKYADLIVTRYCRFTGTTEVILNGERIAWKPSIKKEQDEQKIPAGIV